MGWAGGRDARVANTNKETSLGKDLVSFCFSSFPATLYLAVLARIDGCGGGQDGTGGGAGAVKRHDCVGRGLWGMCGGLHGVPRGTVVGAEVHVVCGVNSANPL